MDSLETGIQSLDINDSPRMFPLTAKATMRPFHSEPTLHTGTSATNITTSPSPLHLTKSSPTLSSPSSLDEEEIDEPYTFSEYMKASDLLECIVAEGSAGFFNNTALLKKLKTDNEDEKKRGSVIGSERVFRLVYGAMKYLPFIDTILVKTQFLVFHNEFLGRIPLVKLLMYSLMKYHFDFSKWPGVVYPVTTSTKSQTSLPPKPTTTTSPFIATESTKLAELKDLVKSLKEFQIKLSASFARLRIEKQASGDCTTSMMKNILPAEVRAKELMAVSMPKYVRVNTEKLSVELLREQMAFDEYAFEPYHNFTQKTKRGESNTDDEGRIVYLDEDFDDLWVVPSSTFEVLKKSTWMQNGLLTPQDKSSFFAPRQLINSITSIKESRPQKAGEVNEPIVVVDTRAGCGTKCCYLASLLSGGKGKVLAFETHPNKLESLRARIALLGLKNIEVIEKEFANMDITDERLANVEAVLVEPPNTGTGIVDKMSYLLQEEEFPSDVYTHTDIATLRRQQAHILQHAFKLPNVQSIVYATRSTHEEENEQIIQEVFTKHNQDYELVTVFPELSVGHQYAFEECLKVPPSSMQNGAFVACFQKIQPEEEVDVAEDGEELVEGAVNGDLVNGATQDANGEKKMKKKKKKGSKLSKSRKTFRIRRVSKVGAPKWDSKTDLSNDKQEGAAMEEAMYGQDFTGLKRFYAPGYTALKELQRTEPSRWNTYSPNPVPWRY